MNKLEDACEFRDITVRHNSLLDLVSEWDILKVTRKYRKPPASFVKVLFEVFGLCCQEWQQ